MPYPQYLYGYPSYTVQPPTAPQVPQVSQMQQPQIQSQNAQISQQPMWANKVYVTSLQDALSRFLSPNSSIVYTLQDEKTEIEVFADAQGKKTYQVYERKPCNSSIEDTTFSKKEIVGITKNELETSINALRNELTEMVRTEVSGIKSKIAGGKKNAE